MAYLGHEENPPCPTCSRQMGLSDQIMLGHCYRCHIDGLTHTMIEKHRCAQLRPYDPDTIPVSMKG